MPLEAVQAAFGGDVSAKVAAHLSEGRGEKLAARRLTLIDKREVRSRSGIMLLLAGVMRLTHRDVAGAPNLTAEQVAIFHGIMGCVACVEPVHASQ